MKASDLKNINPFVREVKIKKSSRLKGEWEDIDHVFIYIAKGSCEYYCSEKGICHLEAGDFIIFPPYLYHELRKQSNSSLIQYIVHFDFYRDPARIKLPHQPALGVPEEERAVIPKRETYHVNEVFISRIPEEDKFIFERLFLNLYQEFTQREDGADLMLRSLCMQLICTAARVQDVEKESEGNGPEVRQVSRKMVETVKEYIYLHYEEKLSNEMLAGIVRVSPNYLSKLFQKHTGMPLHNYLINFRLERARQLLLSGDYNVTEAALKCGFSSVHAFSKTFKQEWGLSPNAYMQTITYEDMHSPIPEDYSPNKHIFYNV